MLRPWSYYAGSLGVGPSFGSMFLRFATYLLALACTVSSLPEILDIKARESRSGNELLKRTIPGLLNRRQEVPFATYDQLCRTYVPDITMCSSVFSPFEVCVRGTDIAPEQTGTVVK